MLFRMDDRLIRQLLLGIAVLHRIGVQAQEQCSLCVDGSAPDMSLMSAELGWSCTDLSTFASTSILKQGDAECVDLQIYGFQDCACPTFPPGFCTLCPGGFSDIPDRSVSVPSTNNLTCGDILFVETALLENGCEDLAPYRDRCGCPTEAECTFCADGTTPTFSNRKLPYLSTPTSSVTCSQQASLAFSAPREQCEDYTVPPVSVNAQGYCGCQGTFPSNLCTLCPAGMQVVNPDLVLPETNGMTCLEMEEYLRYTTDAGACQAIADSSQVCCQTVEPCPVCGSLTVQYDSDKLYEPYGLTCENIGLASDFGFPMTCDDVQTRFPYYCGCPDATPACTLCQLGELPPETDKEIPLLDTTCEQVNDYASLRLTSECAAETASQSFAASAYCGCTGFEAPRACTFCPEGEIVRDPKLVPDGSGGATCGELEDFADYVRTANLCSSVQAFVNPCCMDPNAPTEAPSTGPPTPVPTPPGPTRQPVPTNSPTTAPPQNTFAPTSSARTSSLLIPSLLFIFFSMVAQR